MTTLAPLDCAGCRKCCLGDTITLVPGDDPSLYKTKLVDGQRILAKGRDGNCVYLGPKGCRIHGRQPVMCRVFDCRRYAQAKAGAVETSPGRLAVIAEGRRRLGLAG